MEPDNNMIEILKSKELSILKAFINICDELGLKYFVLYGTLLGAVRHQGFIPWDDDIDVGLFREDYEVFLKKAQALLPSYYELQSYHTEKNLPYSFAKIRDSRTTFIETSTKNLSINHGIYIDVFPIDYYSDSKMTWKKKILLKLYNRRIQAAYYESTELPLLRRVKKEFFDWIIQKIYPNLNYVLRKKDEIIVSYKESALTINHSGAWGKNEIVPRILYDEVDYLEFEKIPVMVPKEYDKWLKNMYGDYMKLPPIEKRVTHHFTEIIDLDRSYKEYL